jgi:peptidoglycan hydrolase-like protein with peptidoglycan-binding domain
MAKLPMPFGDPYTYPGHSGIDFPQPLGTIFRASGPGTVKTLASNLRGGYYIWVQYDVGPLVGYHHMRNFNGCPPVGSRVAEGTRLGYVGDKGQLVTGPHLHSEVAGHATTDGYWLFFDSTRVVGGGGVAGGGSTVWTDAAKQAFLVSIGLDTGGIGNGWGPASAAATDTFQQWVGLPHDGVFGPLTIGKAELVQAGGNRSSRDITAIQTELKRRGFYTGTVDGIWGPLSSIATLRFQISVGLTADALYGPATDAAAFTPGPSPEPAPGPVGENRSTSTTEQIQAFLRDAGLYTGDVDGKYGPATTAAVVAWQTSQHIDADGVWGQTSNGLAFPPEGSTFGVDYSFARPDPALLAERGVKVVLRYLWPAKYNSKGITPAELVALESAGIKVAFIYEEDGKELVSFDAGVRVATAADAELAILGRPNRPVYFNVDYDAPPEAWPGIFAALDGIASVIGWDRVGLYGGEKVIRAAFDAGKIKWGFQTYAWSDGRWDPRAQVQQWSNGQWGGSVDFLRAMVEEFGQSPVVVPDPEPDPDPSPTPGPSGKVTVEASALLGIAGELVTLAGGAT